MGTSEGDWRHQVETQRRRIIGVLTTRDLAEKVKGSVVERARRLGTALMVMD